MNSWKKGDLPITVVMITLNEAHNLDGIARNLENWASEVLIVDSFSKDETVDIALRYGFRIVQRPFDGFGNQWNFAINSMDIKTPWTMKLDPDERISDELKNNIRKEIENPGADGFSVRRRLWLMKQPLPVRQNLLRIWKTGFVKFSDVAVNEYPILDGTEKFLKGDIEHHDSPDLSHWFEKQNRYTSAEAESLFLKRDLSVAPKLFGSSLERRMWMKNNFYNLPFRYSLFFLYHFLLLGAWRVGRVGFIWAKLRTDVMRQVEYKYREIIINNGIFKERYFGAGKPDKRVDQFK